MNAYNSIEIRNGNEITVIGGSGVTSHIRRRQLLPGERYIPAEHSGLLFLIGGLGMFGLILGGVGVPLENRAMEIAGFTMAGTFFCMTTIYYNNVVYIGTGDNPRSGYTQV